MRFKTQDLLVTLDFAPKPWEPGNGGCIAESRYLVAPGVHETLLCRPCTFRWVSCIPCSYKISVPHAELPFEPEGIIENLEDLRAIKERLLGDLKELERLEETGLPSAFRSLEEAERAERGVKEVLERIQVEKQRLG